MIINTQPLCSICIQLTPAVSQCLAAFEKYRIAVLFSRKMKDQRLFFEKKIENLEKLLQVAAKLDV
jgi:hypothetical protein